MNNVWFFNIMQVEECITLVFSSAVSNLCKSPSLPLSLFASVCVTDQEINPWSVLIESRQYLTLLVYDRSNLRLDDAHRLHTHTLGLTELT